MGCKEVACPSCGAFHCEIIGPVRGLYDRFQETMGELRRCHDCGLWFRSRDGSLACDEIDYEGLTMTEGWSNTAGRLDFVYARQWIAKLAPRRFRVLDVGCFCGDFLNTLPPGIEKYGIEPSEKALMIAEAKGVKILGRNVADADIDRESFEVVVALNVFEHLSDPKGSLLRMIGWLKEGGLLILGTGLTDSLPWRLLRNEHWYCRVPGHCVFLSHEWVDWVMRNTDIKIDNWLTIPHRRGSITRKCKEWIHTILFAFPRSSLKAANASAYIYPFSRTVRWEHAPVTKHLPDHVLVCFQKQRAMMPHSSVNL